MTFPDDCDILITYAQPKDENLVATTLTKYSLTAFATPEYIKKHPISKPDDLINHSCILINSMIIDDANIWRFRVNNSEQVLDYKVSGNYICDNTQTALELARNHLGNRLCAKREPGTGDRRGVNGALFHSSGGVVAGSGGYLPQT